MSWNLEHMIFYVFSDCYKFVMLSIILYELCMFNYTFHSGDNIYIEFMAAEVERLRSSAEFLLIELQMAEIAASKKFHLYSGGVTDW